MTKLFAVLALTLAVSATADTLTLRRGTSVAGTWVGIDGGNIRFQVNGQVQEFRVSEVALVTFASDAPPQGRVDAPLPPDVPPPPPIEPPAPPPPDTPPPPPVSTPAQINLKLGSSVAEVVATLGQPLKVTTVGTKQIYQYKDLKVIFEAGRMTDAQ